MSKLEKKETVTVDYVLTMSKEELQGLFRLLNYGTEPGVLNDLKIYSLATLSNNMVGEFTDMREFTAKASFKKAYVEPEEEDYVDDDYNYDYY